MQIGIDERYARKRDVDKRMIRTEEKKSPDAIQPLHILNAMTNRIANDTANQPCRKLTQLPAATPKRG